jgi:hypothetical protein
VHHCSVIECPHNEQKWEEFLKGAWRVGAIPQASYQRDKIQFYYNYQGAVVLAPPVSRRPERNPELL